MVIFGVYIISKSGGLIFNMDHNIPKIENEKKFSFPLDLMLEYDAKKVAVGFGERDGICGEFNQSHTAITFLNWSSILSVGHVLSAVNGTPVTGLQIDDGRNVKEVLENSENYPISLKFIRPKMTTNEKIVLASTFYPLFAIASQLSPEPKSSGIEVLETDSFKLNCFQTLTGVKFMVISEPVQSGMEALLRKIYEHYADYVLKNPFYSLEMPIRCELFDVNVQSLLETVEKTGSTNLIKT